MSTPTCEASASDAALKIWSCVLCRRRKVRCDRRDPCVNCVKSNNDCHYPVTGRVPRRSRAPTSAKSPAQKQAELLSRLRRLEAVVTELSAQVEDGSKDGSKDGPNEQEALSGNYYSTSARSSAWNTTLGAEGLEVPSQASSSGIPSTVNSEPGSEFDEDFGRLVIHKDGSLQIGKGFWSVFCNEVDNILEAVHDAEDDQDEPKEPSTTGFIPDPSLSAQTPRSFVFGCNDANDALIGLSFLPTKMPFVWNIYVERIDPFIKVLHVPTAERKIQGLKGDFSSPGCGLEALLLSISMAAVASMEEDVVSSNFTMPKAQLLAVYRSGTEQALSRAEFLVTKDVVVVQAFAIYLSILPQIGASEVAWPLTGLLVRIAASLGPGGKVDRSSMDKVYTETRNRLNWQMRFLDSGTRKLGTPATTDFELACSTEFPADVDDITLDSMESASQLVKTTPTGMTLCLIRCEIWCLVRALRANPSGTLEQRLNEIRSTRLKIETNYLRHLRPDSSFDSFIRAMASLFFAKVELVIYQRHPQYHPITTDATETGSKLRTLNPLMAATVLVIEAVHALKTEAAWAKWRWQLRGHLPWHAIGSFLREALLQPWSADIERTWCLIVNLQQILPDEAKRGPPWLSLTNLVTIVQAHRGEAMARLEAENVALQQFTNLDSYTSYGDGSANGISEYLWSATDQFHSVLEDASTDVVIEAVSADTADLSITTQGARLNDPKAVQWQFPASDMFWESTKSPAISQTAGVNYDAGYVGLGNGFQEEDMDLMSWQAWDDIGGTDLVWDLN
ncbi:hypothetical protein G7046_g432 [Stylonectria norvegica]|nr:hypothetical protein G7046_g432 [Stylonectria norvegica]